MSGDTTTALAFALPDAFVPKVNEIRTKYDRAAKRWPPHINFLFPFIPTREFEAARENLAESLNSKEAFEVVLDELGFFSQGKGNITFHLKASAESERKFQELFEIIHRTLPSVSTRKEFHPHLTLGQCHRNDWPQLERELRQWLGEGIHTRCEKIVFYHRSPETGDKMVEQMNVALVEP